jgi:predicted metalloprotease with PDZ domain
MRAVALSLTALAFLAGCGAAQADNPVTYEISFENRAHHEAEVTVTWTDIGNAPLELRMSRSSPGRYALHEFAKNVYNFRATGADGAEVTVTRPNPHQWDVSDHGGAVSVTYTLYADHSDGTYAAVDRTHAHLNMPATFMWARGQGDRSIELTVDAPAGSDWRVATQLGPTPDPYRFTAPNLYYFLDSPTEVSDFWLREWDVGGQTVRVALHHAGTDAEADRYADAAAAIVDAAVDIYGALPDFDFGTYTFLACYLPWVDGDGMEHRNSTVLTSTGSLAINMTAVLGTVAHEFFHTWNVERIRPTSLEPFDFEGANMSRELWFAEGFTSYFDDLMLWRADLISSESFAQRMGGIANAVTNARGRKYFSPVEMSMQAPFVDAATSVDPNNRQNTFLSYYTWGSGVALALDLTLRSQYPGVTLDHLMRDMWATHGVNETSYAVDDVEAALARVTGDARFAAVFFSRYVRGTEAPEFTTLLSPYGIVVGPANVGAAWLGQLSMRFDGGAIRLLTPLEDSPLYLAGVDQGDRIVSIDGSVPTDRDALDALIAGMSPGDRAELVFESRGSTYTESVQFGQDQTLSGRWIPEGDANVSQSEMRAAWWLGMR